MHLIPEGPIDEIVIIVLGTYLELNRRYTFHLRAR